tara:strand:+ start:129 stop:620 length:492 start_codon:yes stop_codon:yes gene_type:complete
MDAQLQIVYDTHYNPYEGGAKVAMVLRYEDKVYSSEPREWFDKTNRTTYTNYQGQDCKEERYDVVCIDSMAHDSKQAEILKESLFLDHEFPLTKAIYERVQIYGGAEEGGWYYHKLLPSNLDLQHTKSSEEFIGKLDKYGEGFLEYYELVEGEFTDDRKQRYS